MTPTPGLYWWVRHVDETGISGRGAVAQVAVFEDGSAVMRWLAGRNAAGVGSTVVYASVDDLVRIHGHGDRHTGHLVPVPGFSPPGPLLGDLLHQHPEQMNLSVRARKCMERLGITTIQDLIECTDADLLRAKNVGDTTLREIKARLAERGLQLRNPPT